MDWLLSNWIWIVFGIAMIAMHMFGHGGHGGHSRDKKQDPVPVLQRANQKPDAPPAGYAQADNALRKAADSIDPAPRGAPARTDQDAPPMPKDGKRHHHSG